MRNVVASLFLSLDGVMEKPGKWHSPYFNDEMGAAIPLVRLPDNKEFCLNLDIAKTEEQKALVGRQAADAPLFSIDTDDCIGDYEAMKVRGVEFDGEPTAQP